MDPRELAQMLREEKSGEKSINEKIAKKNKSEHERIAKHGAGGGKFACQDIRVERGELKSVTRIINTRTQQEEEEQTNDQNGSASVSKSKSSDLTHPSEAADRQPAEALNREASSSLLISTTTTATAAAPTTTVSMSDETTTTAGVGTATSAAAATPHVIEDISSILDVIDQSDEHRLHVPRQGRCHVLGLSQDGMFWIRPILSEHSRRILDSLSDQIGMFITRTQFKSFGELAMRPALYSKCFVHDSQRALGSFYLISNY